MANRVAQGFEPSGFWLAQVISVNSDKHISVKIPKLGGESVYEEVRFTGLTPQVGDYVWVSFIEGTPGSIIAFVGENDTSGPPSEADITEVIAGLGLSGGGESGSVTLDFEPSELTTVELTYDDKIVISDDSDSGEPKLVPMSDVVVTVNGDGSGEPIGHEDRTDSTISFDHTSRVFTIAPVGDSYAVWCKGRKYVKTSSETVTIGTASGLYYISFDADGALQATTTFFDWANDTPTAYIYYNSGDTSKYMLFDERHGIVLDWQTHEYLHRTRGAAYANGFDITASVTNGDGSLDSHAQISMDGGTFFDEDLQVDIVHDDTPTANTWEQDLSGPAQIPVFYRSGSTGWTYDTPTDFPVKQGTARPAYNLNTGGTWTTPDLPDSNRYGIQWIVATNNLNYPVLSIMGQDYYDNEGEAEAATWDSMNLDDLPVVEIRVLYKIVFRGSGTNTPGCRFTQIDDYRNALSSATSTAASIVDHGGLTGLGDDDHTQYLLASGTRTADLLDVTGNVSAGSFSTNGSTSTANLIANGTVTFNGTVTVNGGMDGFTLANGISGSNFNITGVNQIEISDPGEGIVWKNGASGDISLFVVDDSNDNVLRTNASAFQVGTTPVSLSGHSHNDLYYTETESNSLYTSTNSFQWRGVPTIPTTNDTTAELKTYLLGLDVFDSHVSAFKTSWNYSGNANLTDAGGLTELAGTSWLTWTDNSTDNTQGNITALVIAPNTGGSGGGVFIYNDQGSNYSPGWREVWTSATDGSGSGLDADLLDGSHASAFATSGHNHTYNVNDAWLRDNGDNAHVKLYGNSRQMVFRTDGTSQYASGVGGYPFVWMYGGDASSNRRMILNTSGQLWLSNYGWLHDYFSASTHGHSYLSTSGGTISGDLTVTGAIYGASGNGDYVLRVGDDAWIGDTDAVNTISFFGNSNDDRCTLQFGRVDGAKIAGYSQSIDILSRFFVPNLLTTTGNNTLRYDGNSSEMLKFTSLRDKKEDIVSISSLLDYLNEESPLYSLNPVIFHEKDQVLDDGDTFNSTRGEYVYGFIAEEIHEVLPEATYMDSDGALVSYSNDSIVALLVSEVQRLKKMVHEMYSVANPDWNPPSIRPAERSDSEKAIFDEAALRLSSPQE